MFLTITGISLLASCSKQIFITPTADNIVIYPSPPDKPRIQYLTSISSSSDILAPQSVFNKLIFGEDQPKSIFKPYGIFIRNGKIYIADSGTRGIEIIDPVNGTFEIFVPTGLGQLKLPINCFVDEEGKLYVADVNRSQVVVFDEEGKFLNAFGEDENYKPTDIFVYDEKIWVANLEGQKVLVYDKKSFNFLFSIPDTEEKTKGFLYQPVNIFLAHDQLYVSDFGDFEVKKYNLEGKFLGSVGGFGRGLGQFVRPKGIAVDRDSNLYVVDAGFDNTQIFNDDGKLLMFFGGAGSSPGSMDLPAGIAITEEMLDHFRPMVYEKFELIYLIFVTNQYGPRKVNVYGYIKPR